MPVVAHKHIWKEMAPLLLLKKEWETIFILQKPIDCPAATIHGNSDGNKVKEITVMPNLQPVFLWRN